MSAKLIIGLAIVVLIIASLTADIVRHGWSPAAELWGKVIGLIVVGLIVGWLIGAGLSETFP